ncbi:hypothetical protein Tco_0635067 [Tanacetum coccineum]
MSPNNDLWSHYRIPQCALLKAWPSTMVSMRNLMKQVKYGDKAAAQAKEEVAITSLYILTKVDKLKKKQQLAKETNEKVVG